MSEFSAFINSAERCVDEGLDGLTAVNTGTVKLKDCRVVLNRACLAADQERSRTQNIALVTGGGSGHDPYAAGYVGEGLLTAAVCGSVFTSPPVAAIVTAITAAATKAAGVLVVVLNYTGDRLNFGRAVEKCRAKGIRVEMHIFGDDSALTNVENTAGRRGLCGAVFLLKLLGALCRQGCSMEELLSTCELVSARCSTLGVAASGCTVPGQQAPLFSVQQGWLELGLGVHGEAGVRLLKSKNAKDLVETMLDHLMSKESDTNVAFEKGDELVVMLNNLGTVMQIEMLILANETKKALEERGFVVQRMYVGGLVTSLDMKGFHISLLRITGQSNWLSLLDEPTTATAWPAPYILESNADDTDILNQLSIPSDETVQSSDYSVTVEVAAQYRVLLEAVVTAAPAWGATLNALDTGCGDGDCGTTFQEGVNKISSCLDSLPYQQPVLLLRHLGDIAGEAMGGTSGGLYSILLSAMSNSLATSVADSQNSVGNSWKKAFTDGIDAVSKYGGAQRCHRTLLDALYPASDAALEMEACDSLWQVLESMGRAAEGGAISTRSMTARAGRASYVRAGDVRKEDAGARAMAYVIMTLAEAAKANNI